MFKRVWPPPDSPVSFMRAFVFMCNAHVHLMPTHYTTEIFNIYHETRPILLMKPTLRRGLIDFYPDELLLLHPASSVSYMEII
jgi:hypothetical protein